MKIRLIPFLLFALLALPLAAQSYDKQWQQVDRLVNKDDQPKQALALVRQIHQRALSEKNDAQLLRSAAAWVQLTGILSPDSAALAVQQMEQIAQGETRAVEHALWCATLGQLLIKETGDTAKVSRGKRYLCEAVSDVNALGKAKAADYLPLFVIGKDSRHYGNDVLHIVVRTVGNCTQIPVSARRDAYARALKYYRQMGNRPATYLVKLDSINLGGGYPKDGGYQELQALRQLAREYRDLALNVHTYLSFLDFNGKACAPDSLLLALAHEGYDLYKKEKQARPLQQYIKAKENPSVQFTTNTDLFYPGDSLRVGLTGKNYRQIRLQLYHTTLTGQQVAERSEQADGNDKYIRRALKGCAVDVTKNHAAAVAWQELRDTLAVALDKEGIYALRITVDGHAQPLRLVYVSRVRTLQIATGNDQLRLVVVDGRSGVPLPDASVVLLDEDGKQLSAHTAATDCTFTLSVPFAARWLVARSGSDVFSRPDESVSYGHSRFYSSQTSTASATRINAFTDRAIYRPGQQVHFGGVVFTQKGDSVGVATPYEAKARLVNANGKEVAAINVFADEMGSFSGSFNLPEATLPGYFGISIKGQDGTQAYQTFRVEEYKRPSFTAEIQAPTADYQLGDTLRLEGIARTYTGLPVAGARVQWTANRSVWFRVESEDPVQSGEAITDAEGRFTLPVYLMASERERGAYLYNQFFFDVRCTVTSDGGETAEAQRTVQASTQKAMLADTWPERVCRESLPRQQFTCLGAAGQQLAHTVVYRLWQQQKDASGKMVDRTCVLTDSVATGAAFLPAVLSALPSGRYRWDAWIEGQPSARLSKAFTLFGETDTWPADAQPFFAYTRHTAQRDSAVVLVGTSAPKAELYYALFADNKLCAFQHFPMSDSLARFDLLYRQEYGESARACFALMVDGQFHHCEADIVRPAPDKRLVLRWSTFRSSLTPGANEEWRLRITHPDGRPADAALMVRLYDQSLDAFGRTQWAFRGMDFYRRPIYTQWRTSGNSTLMGSWVGPNTNWDAAALHFSDWNLPAYYKQYRPYGSARIFTSNFVSPLRQRPVIQLSKDATADAGERVTEATMAPAEGAVAEDKSASTQAVAPRTNFAETALFTTSLRTDAQGEVSLAFTLPQRLTSWRFEALAHTAAMDNGRMDTVAVARRMLMVQPALPRFVRAGDEVALPVTVDNLSSTRQRVKVLFQLLRAANEEVIFSEQRTVDLAAAGHTALTYIYKVPQTTESDQWIVRVTGQSAEYADGEEHLLPVLSSNVEVARSLPFTVQPGASQTLRLDTLWNGKGAIRPTLTLETVANPVWYAVDALPTLMERQPLSANDWATRLYTLCLSQHIASTYPAVREAIVQAAVADSTLPTLRGEGLNATTPWLRAADRERLRREALLDLFDANTFLAHQATALDHLRGLQTAEGGWPWFRGMQPNLHTTLEVTILLVRNPLYAQSNDCRAMVKKAYLYLHNEMARMVEHAKKANRKQPLAVIPTTTALRYLYLCTLLNEDLDATNRYLFDAVRQENASLNIYEKSLLAIVLQGNNEPEAAARLAASLLDYTVSSPEMGRWYDTQRAPLSSSNYRFAAQVAAIEALSEAGKNYEQPVREMKQWIAQSWRTTQGRSNALTADMTYAVLLGRTTNDFPASADVLMTLRADRKILDAPAASAAQGVEGRTRRVYDAASAPALFKAKNATLTVRTTGEEQGWGSAVATFTQPLAAVEPAAAGLSVQRSLQVWRAGSWQPLAEGELLRVGDRVRQVFRLRADRNFDFVCLTAHRPACFAPAKALSGYSCAGSLWAYRAVLDTETQCYFEHMAKGNHEYTEEYYVDRPGTYRQGLSRIASLYAPEYCGHSADGVVKVGK